MSDDKTKILDVCLGKSCKLADMIEYSTDSVVSKTILNKKAGTLTLFAFDKGQGLSEHTSPYDAVVQIIDGNALLTIGGKEVIAAAGEIIVMPANIKHDVQAKEKFKMLLTMIRT